MDQVAWDAAVAIARLRNSIANAASARHAFELIRPIYWRERLHRSWPGEFNTYNRERMLQGKPPIGPDGFPIELGHWEEISKNPSRALDATNIRELFSRQHDFQHGNYAFRWHLGRLPRSPHVANLSPVFGDPLQEQSWP